MKGEDVGMENFEANFTEETVVLNEEVVEPYTEEGEYWIIDRSANGDYSYTILDKNKNSLLTDMIAVSKPTISYLGNDIVKVIHTEERTHSITPLTKNEIIQIKKEC